MARVRFEGQAIELRNGSVFCEDATLQESLGQILAHLPTGRDPDNSHALLLVKLLGAELESLDNMPEIQDWLCY